MSQIFIGMVEPAELNENHLITNHINFVSRVFTLNIICYTSVCLRTISTMVIIIGILIVLRQRWHIKNKCVLLLKIKYTHIYFVYFERKSVCKMEIIRSKSRFSLLLSQQSYTINNNFSMSAICNIFQQKSHFRTFNLKLGPSYTFEWII